MVFHKAISASLSLSWYSLRRTCASNSSVSALAFCRLSISRLAICVALKGNKSQGGRHHSGRTIGRRGHDLPAGGILFIDRHGVNAHPIIDRMRGGHIQPALGHQRFMNGFGSAFYIQTTRQNAAAVEPAIDAIVHHLPDFGQAAVKRGSAAAAQLILAFDLSIVSAGFNPYESNKGMHNGGMQIEMAQTFNLAILNNNMNT